MPSFNHITLLGHLGGDPELRTTVNGRALTRMRLATTHSWRDDNNEWQEQTDWHTVVLFGPAAERVHGRAHKGDLLLVDGRMRMREWTTDDGLRRTTPEVRARRVRVLGRQQVVPGGLGTDVSPAGLPAGAPPGPPQGQPSTPEDDIPF